METQIITRAEAIEQGLTHYFTGKPCRHGHVDSRYTASATCITCMKLKVTKWVNNNLDRRIEIARKHHLKKQYGLNPEQYTQMYIVQKGLCAVCFKSCRRHKNLCVDHCHTTGEIRRLLCHDCNTALGLLQENPDIIKSLLTYIIQHKGT